MKGIYNIVPRDGKGSDGGSSQPIAENSVGSKEIQDGSVMLEDLNPEVKQQLAGETATKEDIANLFNKDD